MVDKKEFNAYLNELMSKDRYNKNLENLSRKRSNIANIFAYLSIGVLVVTFPFLLFYWWVMVIGIIVSVLLAIMAAKMANLESMARRYYESQYINKITDYLLSDYEYTLSKGKFISKKIFEASQFVKSEIKYYNGEDLIVLDIPKSNSGEFRYQLFLSDIYAKKDDAVKETIITDVCYDGIFGYIEFDFNFDCSLCINSEYKKDGLVLEKVELEDIIFNEQFKVLSDNQVEARYVLTATVMETLLDLRKHVPDFKLTMIDNKMYFGFPKAKLFDYSYVKEGDVTSMFKGFYDPVCASLKIVEEVNKNKKVFKI